MQSFGVLMLQCLGHELTAETVSLLKYRTTPDSAAVVPELNLLPDAKIHKKKDSRRNLSGIMIKTTDPNGRGVSELTQPIGDQEVLYSYNPSSSGVFTFCFISNGANLRLDSELPDYRNWSIGRFQH